MPLSQLHYAVTMERTPTRSESPVYVQLVSGIANVLSGHAVYSWAANNLPESMSRFWSYLLRPKTEEKGSCVEPPTAREFCFQDRKDDEDDKDEDGGTRVCREDVEVVMGKLGLFCSHESGGDEELVSWDRSMSCGGISRVFEEEEASTEEVREAFYVFDVNRDGFIDAKELQRVLCVLGFDDAAGGMKGEEECERMIRVFDENGDGGIDFQEFVKLVEKGFC